MYIKSFLMPRDEYKFMVGYDKAKMTCYRSLYPFGIFPEKQLSRLEFSPVTFFYGGNGSGKTTLLNIIAERLKADRGTLFNRNACFDDFVNLCDFEPDKACHEAPEEIRMIASDDVFDYVLDVRAANENIDRRRENVFKEYMDEKYTSFQMKSMADFEKLKKNNRAKRMTISKYTNTSVMANLPEKSNGESAYIYFTENIKERFLYLLDEPENSLSVALQVKLKQFIEESARFFGCQFMIATHSPVMLSMNGAAVYDLDVCPVRTRRWTELENVRTWFEFFESHRDEFLR